MTRLTPSDHAADARRGASYQQRCCQRRLICSLARRPSKRHSQAGFLDGDAGSSKSVMPGGQYRNQSDNQEDSKPAWAEANEVRRHTN